jgi:hypothetical protein
MTTEPADEAEPAADTELAVEDRELAHASPS